MIPEATANSQPAVQQDFVDRIREESLFSQLPPIAGGDDGAAPPASNGGQPGVTPESGQGSGSSTPSPSQGGQGGAAKGDGGFNWGLFPDVPEEQKSLLEPHLKNVQGHVTKLEQQMAPLKPFLDQGVTPEVISGYVQLDQAFSQDPQGTWLNIARQLQQEGRLSDELDLDAVAEVLAGPATPSSQESTGPEPGTDVDPQLKAALDEIAELRGRLDNRDQTEQEAKQEQMLNQSLEGMRSQLIEAGIAKESLSDEMLVGQILAAHGDVDVATKAILDFRQAELSGFTQKARDNKKSNELELPNGVPGAPEKTGGDAWAQARAGATHMLKQRSTGN